jgi:hypothetical protein
MPSRTLKIALRWVSYRSKVGQLPKQSGSVTEAKWVSYRKNRSQSGSVTEQGGSVTENPCLSS